MYGLIAAAPNPTTDDAGARDGFRIGKRAAVENRNFKVIELDIGIVDSDAVQGRKQMLHRRNPNAPAHERRRVSDARYCCDVGTKLEIVQVDAPEDNALAGRSGQNTQTRLLTRVKADSAEFDRAGQRPLMHKRSRKQLSDRIQLA